MPVGRLLFGGTERGWEEIWSCEMADKAMHINSDSAEGEWEDPLSIIAFGPQAEWKDKPREWFLAKLKTLPQRVKGSYMVGVYEE